MDSLSSIFYTLTVGVLLLTVHVFLVLSSVAITRSRERNLQEMADKKTLGAPRALEILEQSDRYLFISQIGRFVAAFFSGYFFFRLSDLLSLWMWGEDSGLPFVLSLIVVSFIIVVSLLLAIQLAKSLAFSKPERVLSFSSAPLFVISKVFVPVVVIVEAAIKLCSIFFNFKVPVEKELGVSAEELSEMVELSREAGEIEEDEHEMIQGVFDFSDTIVREVMTPRTDIVSIEETASFEEVVDIFDSEGLSRLIVTGSNLDDVHGVLLAKDLISYFKRKTVSGEPFKIDELIRPAYFVNNTKKIDDLLQELRTKRVHMAVVLDEHGGVDGLVTIEDLIEEIVGEIDDEYDSPESEEISREAVAGDLLIDASMLVDDFNKTYNLALPNGQYDTMAGFFIHQLGRLPEPEEEIVFEGTIFKVVDVSQNRITRMKVMRTGAGEEV